jgi:hypothetical protein
MNETELESIAGDLQSFGNTIGHCDSDETKDWTQATSEGLFERPNQAAPVFLNPESTDIF